MTKKNAFALAFSGLLFAASIFACSSQGEGEYCNSTTDCASLNGVQMICGARSSLSAKDKDGTSAAKVCCPADGSNGTGFCSTSSNGETNPDAAGGDDGDASTDTDAASESDASTVDSGAEETNDAATSSDASSSTDASSDADATP